MAKEEIIGITVKKDEDFPEWYTEVVLKAGLADYAPIRGCIVFRPYSYAIWESIQDFLNAEIKKRGVQNAYFPLFIPEGFLSKEAEHFEGFTPEVGWMETEEGEERLALRPTSETIMYDSYSRWIKSHRDLPLKLNQWANIIRWETKVTKPFIRTREFLWQEGHTAHATKEEAEKEVQSALDMYVDLIENQLAIPLIYGKKSEMEKFAGADYTLTVEAMMPDGKALQMGTSHMLGQNFAKSFNISFLDENEKQQHVWQTSWGISTRLIGAVVMAHGDDRGLVLPPRIAPIQAVIVPIVFEKVKKDVLKKAAEIKKQLEKSFRVILDNRDNYSPGWKYHEWEMRGVPLRIEIGPKDLEKGQAVLVRRDNGEKTAVKLNALPKKVDEMLGTIQKNLFQRAKKFMEKNTHTAKDYAEFKKIIGEKRGFVLVPWCGNRGCEEKIKDETSATIRCLGKESKGRCICCGNGAKNSAYFAKSY